MKLRLILTEADAPIRDLLRFSPIKADISIVEAAIVEAASSRLIVDATSCRMSIEAPKLQDEASTLTRQDDVSTLPAASVYLSLEAALKQDGIKASLHLHQAFSLLWVGESDIDQLQELAKTQELYCFAEDTIARAVLSSLPYHAISVIHSFYANSNIQKTLVLSSRQSCDLVLSQDPAAFVHQIITDHGTRYSLAADLHGYEALAINRALNVLHGLQVEPGALISSVRARKALKTGSSSYSFFADRYDEYMAHVDYDLWITNIMFWQKEYARSQGKKALELACGTANIGSRLVVEGYEVDACDLSPQMLMGASKKAVKPSLYQASLTDPIPGRDYDLIFCLFDSINYLLSSADIRICFNQVSKALKPGGIFIFDISTLLNSMENFADNCSFSQSGDFYMVHEAWYEPHHKRQISRLTGFEAKGPGFALQHEEHHQRVYLCSELVAMIEDSPLKLLAIRSAQGKTNLLHKRISTLDKQYHRLFFIAGLDASAVS